MRNALLTATAGLLLTATPAIASGPPPTTTSADRGIAAVGGGIRYLATPGGGDTLVQRVHRGGRRLERAVPGAWGIPAVAQDGSASGLSADGRTLILADRRAAFPSHRTRYLVLDAGTLRVRDRIALRGTFSFDAISPDGGTLYLIRYTGGNPTDYAVRAYDVAVGRLLPKPIVDPREPDEKMVGIPVTRTYSHDGVWAYTLYVGDKPFVHALDTRDRIARCIDVPQVGTSVDFGAIELRLSADGGRLAIDGGATNAIVDTRTFKVSTPPLAAPAPKPRAPATAADHGDGSGAPWGLIGGIGIALVLAGFGVTVAMRRYAGSASPE